MGGSRRTGLDWVSPTLYLLARRASERTRLLPGCTMHTATRTSSPIALSTLVLVSPTREREDQVATRLHYAHGDKNQ